MQEYYPLLLWVIIGTVGSAFGFFFAFKERKEARLKKLRELEERRRQSELDFTHKDRSQRTA